MSAPTLDAVTDIDAATHRRLASPCSTTSGPCSRPPTGRRPRSTR